MNQPTAPSPGMRNRSSVRLLETRSGTATTELLWLASAWVGYEEELVVLQQEFLEFTLLRLVAVLLVVSNDRFGNCLSDGENLGGCTTTTDAHLHIHVLELVAAEQEERLECLESQRCGFQNVDGLAVHI